MFQADLDTLVTSFPELPRERVHRRALAALASRYRWLEVALDRLVSPSLNPLYHTGAIAVFALAVATITGIYLFLFYRVGTAAAHASVESIVAQPLGIGSLARSLHRYASDAAIVAALLHGLKMLLTDRFWGARWIVPPHMRPVDTARTVTGRRADGLLSVELDGRTVLTRTYRPTGLRRDGPIYGYEEIAVRPGAYHLVVRLAASDSSEPHTLMREIEVLPSQAPLIEHLGSGWHDWLTDPAR